VVGSSTRTRTWNQSV